MKIYGPYKRKDGRQHVIEYDGVQRKTISYPKHLMENHLGKKLEPNETVDHIDKDFSNDSLGNLQVLDRQEHTVLDAKRAKKVEITCVLCGNKALKSGNDLRGNSKQEKAGPFCSRKCAGLYGANVQNNKQKKLPVQSSPKSEYYYKNKL